MILQVDPTCLRLPLLFTNFFAPGRSPVFFSSLSFSPYHDQKEKNGSSLFYCMNEKENTKKKKGRDRDREYRTISSFVV